MAMSRPQGNRRTRHAALLAVASTALLAAAACSSGSGITVTGNAPTLGSTSATPGDATPASATASARAATGAAVAAAVAAAAGSQAPAQTPAGSAPLSVPACGNDNLALGNGYGTQSLPVQAQSIVITNVSGHTCTLRGYTGAAIEVDGKTVNATRTLNVQRGDLPPLSSPPLVTLAPGASAYSVLEWVVGKGSGCYPTGTGLLEATAPNTTRSVELSKAMQVGSGAICSGFEVGPVLAGYFGVPVGVPARN